MTGDREASLDLAQDTFVAAWENRKSFRKEADFSSWLYRIASNKTLNYLKSARLQSPAEDPDRVEMPEGISDPERELIKKELASKVLGFMAGLPDQQRLIFDLRFYQGMSFQEIAETTGRALGTVKTGYREAIMKLRKYALEKGWQI
jgi:RNA polymerase sigma-70 factor (ECF subfamily)